MCVQKTKLLCILGPVARFDLLHVSYSDNFYIYMIIVVFIFYSLRVCSLLYAIVSLAKSRLMLTSLYLQPIVQLFGFFMSH